MRALREWLHRLWATLRPTRPDADLDEEFTPSAIAACRRGRFDAVAAHPPRSAIVEAGLQARGGD